jgi:hypothetical protein
MFAASISLKMNIFFTGYHPIAPSAMEPSTSERGSFVDPIDCADPFPFGILTLYPLDSPTIFVMMPHRMVISGNA